MVTEPRYLTFCPTCDAEMQRKIYVDDLILYWCPVCGTVIQYAPDLEDHKAVWVPWRHHRVITRDSQQSKEQAQ